MPQIICQGSDKTNVPIMNVVGGGLAQTFSLASAPIFDQVVIGGTDDAPQIHDVTVPYQTNWQSRFRMEEPDNYFDSSGVLAVDTADSLDIFKKILVVTQAGMDWLDFYELANEWKQNRKNISAFGGDTRDPNYLRIIGMGWRAVPCILRQLRNEMLAGEPDHWFTALWAITGENPVPEENRGRIREMAGAWLAWGDRRGRANAEGVATRISASR